MMSRRFNESGSGRWSVGCGLLKLEGFSLRCINVALFTICVSLLMRVLPASAQSLSPVLVLSTIAGSGTATDSGDGGPALSAGMKSPVGVAIDKAGNIYIAEANDVIRKVGADGTISTVVGTSGVAGHSGDGGPATAALLSTTYSVAVDNNGNLLIADEGNSVIRRVDAVTGIITTIAGTLDTPGRTGDGGPATSALLSAPYGVTTDRSGNIYISDYGNRVIREVDTSGVITTFAGNGTSGSTGAGIKAPFRTWVDAAGNVYITDYSGAEIRMVDTSGIIHTIAGNGTVATKNHLGDGGPATSGELSSPRDAIGDNLGNIYIDDEADQVIRVVDANGVINTIAGTPNVSSATTPMGDGGSATAGSFYYPYDIAIDARNNLYIADDNNSRIRRLSLNTILPTTAVGASSTQNLLVQSKTAVTPSTSAITPSTEFVLGKLSGCSLGTQLAANTPCTVPVTFEPTAPGLQTAQLAFTEASGNVSVIGLSGIGTAPQAAFSLAGITTIAGNGAAGTAGPSAPAASAQVNAPRGGVIDSAGNIYFADSGNNVIRRIDAASGTLSTVAGNGTAGYGGDGTAAIAAELNAPAKVVLDAAGSLYIADTGNNTIRFVDAATGIISTIAGNGTAGYAGDGGAATVSELNAPQGLAVDLGGHLYVADTGNNVIRYFGKGGQISTFTGTGVAGYSGDGADAHSAALNTPESVVLDQSGDIYIADTGNGVVRMISSRNQISTLAGQQGEAANTGDGGVATAATVDHPSDVALDAAGDMYIAAGGQVRLVNAAGIISTLAGTGASGSYSGEGGAATSAVLPAPISNLMVDSGGNVVLADTAGNRLLKVSATTPMPMNFGVQAPGTTGQARTLSVLNSGNSTLNIGGITATAGFILQTAGTSDCAPTTSLAPGQSCSIGVVFSPGNTANGAVTGTLTLTNNTLNGTGVAQAFALAGSTKVLPNTTTVVSVTPASPIYGASLTLIATVNNGNSSTTGTVNFSVNGTSVGSQPVSNNQASITLPSFPVGAIQIGASYSGDSNNNSSAGTGSVTIHPAVLTVTANNASVAFGATPAAFTYTISGFVNGDSSNVVTGAPVETTTATSASPQGTYPITPSLGTLAAANYTFIFMNGTLTVGPPPAPDFLFGVTPSTITLLASQPSTVATLTLIPLYNYTGTVKISCTSVPQGLGCSGASLTGGGGPVSGNGQGNPAWAQVNISNSSSVAAYRAPAQSRQSWLAMEMPLCFLALATFRGKKNKRNGKLLGLILLPLLITGATSCSSKSVAPPATKGSYQVTITATDSSAQLSHSTTITLLLE
jgi:sugar lactone lactonase YvrE